MKFKIAITIAAVALAAYTFWPADSKTIQAQPESEPTILNGNGTKGADLPPLAQQHQAKGTANGVKGNGRTRPPFLINTHFDSPPPPQPQQPLGDSFGVNVGNGAADIDFPPDTSRLNFQQLLQTMTSEATAIFCGKNSGGKCAAFLPKAGQSIEIIHPSTNGPPPPAPRA